MEKYVEIIIIAFVIDLLIGDPQNPLHPVRLIGSFIGFGTKLYKKLNVKSKAVNFMLGMLLSLLTVALTYTAAKTALNICYNTNFTAGFLFEAVLCYFVVAAKSLKTESMKVYRSLEAEDIKGARKNLSYIVGRDTKNLSKPAIIKATVETIAENLSDGVIAPLLFVFIGGAPLGLAYKAVNTLDSMIGYRNETYEYFGKFAARLDDAVNFIPARITALLMIIATPIMGGSIKGAIKTYMKDRYNHKSPNSAQTEAVCAGALGVQLGGGSYYNGKLVQKPTIGENVLMPDITHIVKANKLMYAATVVTIALFSLIWLIWEVFYV